MKAFLRTITLSIALPLFTILACNTEDTAKEKAHYSTTDYLEQILVMETSRNETPLINVWEDSLEGFQVTGSYQGIEYYYKQSSFPEDTVQMKIEALNL